MNVTIPRYAMHDLDNITIKENTTYFCKNVVAKNIVVFPDATLDVTCSSITTSNFLVLGNLYTDKTVIKGVKTVIKGFEAPVGTNLLDYGLQPAEAKEILRRLSKPTDLLLPVSIPGGEIILSPKFVEICVASCKNCQVRAGYGQDCDIDSFYDNTVAIHDQCDRDEMYDID